MADYEKNGTIREKVRIGTSITAVDLPDRTVLIRCHEAAQMDDANSLASTFQLREADCIVEDRARRHRGGQFIGVDGKTLNTVCRTGLHCLDQACAWWRSSLVPHHQFHGSEETIEPVLVGGPLWFLIASWQ